MEFLPYLCLALLRIVLTCLPQTGYIHPDEFYQSIEVLAGKFFDVDLNKPWEYNPRFPIRSIAPSYLTVGVGLKILKSINYFLNEFFNISIISPYFIVVFPRLLMCSLSFFVDYSLYKICSANNEKYTARLLILASSYVIIVYGTRTFSNTTELILFSLLLYYVAESMLFSNIVIRQREYLNFRYKKAANVVERAKMHKLRLFLSNHSLRNCFIIATISTVGFFNRPTFVAYAVAPVFFWLYRGIGFRSVNSLQFHLRIVSFLASTIPTVILLILIDSFYYGYLSMGEIGVFEISLNNFVVTPLNFIKYNINSTNLAQHGLHPRYLHTCINVPLLFNILGVLSITGILEMFHRLLQAKYNCLPTLRSIKGLMTASFLTPILFLSVFQHQEPRFIIPILLPLVYLHGQSLLQDPDYAVVKPAKPVQTTSIGKRQQSRLLVQLWFIVNAICVAFYGFIHQGGVYSAANQLSKQICIDTTATTYHVVSSHVYSIPEALFIRRLSNQGEYKVNNKKVTLYEEGSRPLQLVMKKIETILKVCYKKNLAAKKSQCKLYFVIPASLRHSFRTVLLNYDEDVALHLNKFDTFYPHLSMEALPNLLEVPFPIFHMELDKYYESVLDYLIALCGSFSLDMYEVSLGNKTDIK